MKPKHTDNFDGDFNFNEPLVKQTETLEMSIGCALTALIMLLMFVGIMILVSGMKDATGSHTEEWTAEGELYLIKNAE